MTWVRLPSLPGYMYKCKILMEIGETIGTVAKLDLNTDSRIQGHFTGLVVYVDLDKPLFARLESLKQASVNNEGSGKEGVSYEHWVLVERNSWWKPRDTRMAGDGFLGKKEEGSRFSALISLDNKDERFGDKEKILGLTEAISPTGSKGFEKSRGNKPIALKENDGPLKERVNKVLVENTGLNNSFIIQELGQGFGSIMVDRGHIPTNMDQAMCNTPNPYPSLK
ncbi:hypothetical protein Golax_023404 [Gossypium laxum]|uniref:DUF4283 domain-containing protein n=1 Tax=Gossypium laxum TaxID=34288 RepID=A0A7J9B048_9ROSI|nr:hypothetical protein [Gossypium laxum]